MNIRLEDIQEDIKSSVKIALAEDIGTGDITAELIPAEQVNEAQVITREDCVLCGTAWFDEVFKQLGDVSTEWEYKDGDEVSANSVLVKLKGNTRNLLTGERTALNFLQLLSGVATKSREYAKLVEGTQIKVLDTRKTIPGLRTAQKYAVTVGGCHNHRIGLYDAFLIKENHIAACGSITEAVEKARALYPDKAVIVEVENMEEFEEAAGCDADRIMLDDFSQNSLTELLAITQYPVEISGSLNPEKVADIKDQHTTSVYCSVGKLSKEVIATDLSMKIYPCLNHSAKEPPSNNKKTQH